MFTPNVGAGVEGRPAMTKTLRKIHACRARAEIAKRFVTSEAATISHG
jgi:hypothetical protein